jgi:hypothetical protein
VFYGRGGYDYDTVYNMPIWLRNISFRFIQESINQEHEAQQKEYGKITPGGGAKNTNLDWANPDRSKLK